MRRGQRKEESLTRKLFYYCPDTGEISNECDVSDLTPEQITAAHYLLLIKARPNVIVVDSDDAEEMARIKENKCKPSPL